VDTDKLAALRQELWANLGYSPAWGYRPADAFQVRRLTKLLNGHAHDITRDGSSSYTDDCGGLYGEDRRDRFLARPGGVHPPADVLWLNADGSRTNLAALMRENGEWGGHKPDRERVVWRTSARRETRKAEIAARDAQFAMEMLLDRLSFRQLSDRIGVPAKTLYKKPTLRLADSLRDYGRDLVILIGHDRDDVSRAQIVAATGATPYKIRRAIQEGRDGLRRHKEAHEWIEHNAWKNANPLAVVANGLPPPVRPKDLMMDLVWLGVSAHYIDQAMRTAA
jgi:hypothetical protein